MNQTYTDWQWIILLNNGAKYVSRDPRIRIIECPFASTSVGFLKRLACMNATGEIIAEVDHDDLITPNCLEKVVKAFEDPEVGFVYSQNAKLSKDFRPYMAEYGWSHSYFTWRGVRLFAMHNQPVYPGRLGHIYFAPDHIRAWRTSVYESIGGHDDTLPVCDDLDLMHRLYKITLFKEIPEVLYLYRIDGSNTYIQRGKLIREMNTKIYDKHIEDLARRYAQINNLNVITLTPEIDLSEIADASAGVVIAKDVLHYFDDTKKVMSEVHRVLAPGGMLISETPSTDGRGAFADPLARSFWNQNTFLYYMKENYARKIGNKSMFRECKLTTLCRDEKGKEQREAYVIAHLEKL